MPKAKVKAVVTTEPKATIEKQETTLVDLAEEVRQLQRQVDGARRDYERAEIQLAKALESLHEMGYKGRTLDELEKEINAQVAELTNRAGVLREEVDSLTRDAQEAYLAGRG